MKNDENSGVKCEVVNCVYHEGNNTCTADTIHVGNHSACTCSETCCDTFSAK